MAAILDIAARAQKFSNFSMHQNHVKTQIATTHPQSFWLRRSGLEPEKFPGDADVVDSGTILWEGLIFLTFNNCQLVPLGKNISSPWFTCITYSEIIF